MFIWIDAKASEGEISLDADEGESLLLKMRYIALRFIQSVCSIVAQRGKKKPKVSPNKRGQGGKILNQRLLKKGRPILKLWWVAGFSNVNACLRW